VTKRTKQCGKCGQELPLEKFNKNKKTKDGLQQECRKCMNRRNREHYKKNRERLLLQKREYNRTEQAQKIRRDYRKKNRGRILQQVNGYYKTEHGQTVRLEYMYGVTLEQHRQMYIDQNGCCKLCNSSVPYDKIDTDHDHKTGKVRGLLCRACNIGIGQLGDTVEGVIRAVEYLRGTSDDN